MTISSKISFAKWLIKKPLAALKEWVEEQKWNWKHNREEVYVGLFFVSMLAPLIVGALGLFVFGPYSFLIFLFELIPLFTYLYWSYQEDMSQITSPNFVLENTSKKEDEL